MALPVNLGVVTLQGSFVKPDGEGGSPDTGFVTIRSDVVISSAGGSVGPFYFRAELVDGGFLIPGVPVTDDPDWSPAGWTYLIKESLSGSVRTYYVAIPSNMAGTTVDLSTLAPAQQIPDFDTYVLRSQANTPNGYAALDSDGYVDPDVLPGGLGGSVSWSSVTGKPTTFPPDAHTHDDRYYTEAEVNTALSGKSDTGHTHAGGASPTEVTFVAQPTRPHANGLLYYNSDENALEFHNSFTGIRHQVGMEDWVLVRNESGSSIAEGKAVYINGSSSGTGHPTIALARADDPTTTVAVGITTMVIPNNSLGIITTDGVVHCNTSGFTAGGSVFVSPTVAGDLTQTAPTAPNYRMRLGICGRSHATLGTIIVTPTAAALANGSANQFLSIHPTNGRQQWKTIQGTTGKVTVTHADGTTTVSVPASGVVATVATLSDAATIATDASAGSHFRIVLAGNRTLGTPTNPTDGQRVLWEFIQDATGGRTITLNSSFVNFTGTTITLPAGANKRAYMGAVYKASTSTWDVIAFAVQP